MLDFSCPENPVHEAIYAYWRTGILRAGIELRAFARLAEVPGRSAADLADDLGADPSFLRAWLEASVALAFLVHQGEGYALSEASRAALTPGSPDFVGDLALHITNHWGTMGQLADLIRDGRAAAPPTTGFVTEARYWRDYMRGQHDRAVAGQGQSLVRGVDLSGARRLVDLGGGMASYSAALCEVNPDLMIDLVDVAESLAQARAVVAARGLTERIRLVEGDFHDVRLEGGYDAALISGVVCISSPEQCVVAFRRAYDLLRPGGVLVVQDFFRIDDSPRRALLDDLMDLYLKVAFTPRAGDHEGERVMDWLRAAGFEQITPIRTMTQLEVITGRRPG